MRKLILAFVSSLVLLAVPVTVSAYRPFDTACSSGNTADSAVCAGQDKETVNDPITGPTGLIIKAAQIVSLATGVAAVLVIIIAGIRFMTASGDPSSINQAKNTILYAVIGLIVAILAQAIIAFVVNRIL